MTRVRLELTLDELHATIRESIAATLRPHLTTIARVVAGAIHPRDARGLPCECMACTHAGEVIRPLGRVELERAFAELGRNAAGALMVFAVEEDEAGCSCGWRGAAELVDEHDCRLAMCECPIGRDDGTVDRCALPVSHGGACRTGR